MIHKTIKSILVRLLVSGLIFAIPSFVYGQVAISEIMYDMSGTDTGREWIEVQNIGSASIDLSTWKLFEANSNHKITALSSATLPSQGFAIIADNSDKFKVDNPQYEGLLFDSTFSLSNDGETIIVRNDASLDVDTLTYNPSIGAAGDGTSLQKMGTSWISALPSPGRETTATESIHPEAAGENTASTSSDQDQSTSSDQSGSTDGELLPEQDSKVLLSYSSQAVATVSRDPVSFQVTAGRPRLGFVGAPLSFEAKMKVGKNLPSGGIVASWSMGDGTEKSGRIISHTYQFPGDYLVLLNADFSGNSAVSKVKVKIVDPSISLSFNPQGYIQIDNLSDIELNLGRWIIETESVRFIIPQDTLVYPHASVKLPSKATGIAYFTKYLRIANPSGVVLTTLSTFKAGGPDDISISLPDGESSDSLLHRLEDITRK